MFEQILKSRDELYRSLFSPEYLDNPFPFYQSMHAVSGDSGIIKLPREYSVLPSVDTYLVSSYESCDVLFRDKVHIGALDMVDQYIRSGAFRTADEALSHRLLRRMHRTMAFCNPPDHTKIRRFFSHEFNYLVQKDSVRLIDELLERVSDSLGNSSSGDFHKQFIEPLTFLLICEVFGISKDDQELMLPRIKHTIGAIDPVPLSLEAIEEYDALLSDTGAFFQYLYDKAPEGSKMLFQILRDKHEASPELSDFELMVNIQFLFAAGHETNANFLSNTLYALYTKFPDQLQALKDDPKLVDQSIDELFRYSAPVQVVSRIVLSDMLYGEHQIAKDSRLLLLIGAANRDPKRYSAPDLLDLSRSNVRELSFGGGLHYCLGVHLAKMLAKRFFPFFFSAFPNFCVEKQPIERVGTVALWGMKSLKATW